MNSQQLLDLDYLTKKYDETNVPLYLSYPTTGFWKTVPESTAYLAEIQKFFHNGQKPFLYFHFPFCQKACYYCCCYKIITDDDNQLDLYIQYLKKEMDLKMSENNGKKLNISQLHWGGGTPTLLSLRQINDIYSYISDYIEIDHSNKSGISIEAYPDEKVLTDEKIKHLFDAGFNEISFGIQDFHPRVQNIINRDCDIDTFKKILEKVKKIGFRVHADLCYGLPFQGLSEFEHTLQETVRLDLDRIAVFPYAHNPFLFPLQRKIPISSIPNSFTKTLQSILADDKFCAAGYKKIGIDHYVKNTNSIYHDYLKGKAIKDFMGYSVSDRRNLIGFGLSAISSLTGQLYHNCLGLDSYYLKLDNNILPFENTMSHKMDRDDFIRNKIILKHILTDFRINKKSLEQEFGIHFDNYFDNELQKLKSLIEDGLLKIDNNEINITDKGEHLARNIALVFDKYYKN